MRSICGVACPAFLAAAPAVCGGAQFQGEEEGRTRFVDKHCREKRKVELVVVNDGQGGLNRLSSSPSDFLFLLSFSFVPFRSKR